MSIFEALGAAGRATDKNITDYTSRLTNLQALHDTQVTAELARRRRLNTQAVPEDELPEPPGPPPMVPGLPEPGAVAPAAPTATTKPAPRKSNLPTPSQATENQSDAESRRLAGKPTPAEAAAAGERPGRKTPALEKAKRDAEMRRYEELRRLNQSIPVPNQSAAETARLNRSGDPDARPAQPALGGDILTPEFFARQRQVESGGDPNAVSPKGAVGVMQTMPGTLVDPGFGVTPARDRSPAELQRVGEDYMRAMLAKFGNMRDALVAYNWGPGNAQKWLQAGGDVSRLPAETQGYLRKLLGNAVNAVVPSAQAAQPTQPAAQGAPAVAPQTFAPGQFAAITPQTDQLVRMARLTLQNANNQLQYTADPQERAALFAQAQQARGIIYEAQLTATTTRARAGDVSALTQLAQVAGVPFAQTPQGFVAVAVDPVTGNGRATSRPMDADSFAQALYTRVSAAARQAEAAAAQKRAEEQAKTQGAIAVEEVKGRYAMMKLDAESQIRAQEELQKYNMSADDVKSVETDPTTGKPTAMYTKRGVFVYQPETQTKGGTSPARWVAINQP